VAIANALVNGERDFEKIVIVADKRKNDDFIYPCGGCLDMITEMKIPEVICANTDLEYEINKTRDMLPKRPWL